MAALKFPSFDEWMVQRGHPEDTLSVPDGMGGQRLLVGQEKEHRVAQLRNFYGHDREAFVESVKTARDAGGAEFKVGDTVTMTFRVTALHPILDAETGMRKTDACHVNLARILPDGTVRHTISAPAHHVQLAKKEKAEK